MTDGAGVSTLLFDVMGTLVVDPFYRELPAFFCLSFEELLDQKHPTTWVEFETGFVDERTALARMFRDGRAVDGGGLRAAMRHSYRWIEGMEDLLAELAAAGRPLHVLSNYPVWYEIIEEKLGLSRYLPWTFVSCHTGVRKPAAAAYLGAARTLGMQPCELLLIDDQPANCAGASQVGLDAIRFTGAGELRRALHARGLL